MSGSLALSRWRGYGYLLMRLSCFRLSSSYRNARGASPGSIPFLNLLGQVRVFTLLKDATSQRDSAAAAKTGCTQAHSPREEVTFARTYVSPGFKV